MRVHGHTMIWNIVCMSDTLIMEWTLADIRNRVVRVAARRVSWLGILGSVLLHILNSFQLRCVATLIFLGPQRLKLAGTYITFRWLLQILIWFERTFPGIILRHQVLLENISVVWIFGKTHQVIEISLKGLLPLFFRNFLRVYFLELWESFNDKRSVQLFLGARVVREPKHLQVFQTLQVVNFIQVTDTIFPQIQFLDSGAACKVRERRNFVNRQRNYFEVSQLTNYLDVVQIASPEIYIFDLLEIVFLALFNNQVCG